MERSPGKAEDGAARRPSPGDVEWGVRLNRKVALVTGAASGIGEAVTTRLLAEGAAVAAVDRDTESLDRAMASWEQVARAPGVRAIAADVSLPDDVERMAAACSAAFRRIDILVCNAGVEARGTVAEITLKEWDSVLATNLSGVFLCAKYVVPVMIEQGGGAIINMASQLGIVGFPRFAAYNAAKGGVVNLTRNMAIDFAAHNIRVNAVCPGPIDTPHLARSLAELPEPERAIARQQLIAKVPLGRIGRPDEIAGCVAFLASEDAAYITGSLLIVDGGYTAI